MMRAALVAVAVVAAAGSGAPAPAPGYSGVTLQGWTSDSRAVAYVTTLDALPDSSAHFYYHFLVVADADGSVSHRYRSKKQVDDFSKTPEGEAAWESAEPEEKGEAWRAQHGLVPVPDSQQLKRGKRVQLPPPWSAATARIEVSADKCPAAALVIEMGGIEQRLFADPCPNSAPREHAAFLLHAAPSPDGAKVALALDVRRSPDTRHEPDVMRGYFAVVSRRSLASVDLLDAGAGTAALTIAERLRQAGFRVAHQAKALAARPTTAIFFAPPFEAEARAIAELLGADAKSVQPLSWKSPFAITVAVAPTAAKQ